MDDNDLQKQLLKAFKTEAAERIQSLFSSLSEMEKASGAENRQRQVEVVFREAHSLKGAARAVNLPDIEALCQVMEGVFSDIKQEKLGPSTRMFDLFHRAAGSIETYLTAPPEDLPGLSAEMEELGRSLVKLKTGHKKQAGPEKTVIKTDRDKKRHEDRQSDRSAEQPRPLFGGTVRIPAAKLDGLLLRAEELITAKQVLNQHLHRLRGSAGDVLALKKQWERATPDLQKTKGGSDAFSVPNRFMQLLESGHRELENTSGRINTLIKDFEQSNRMLGGMADDLLDEMKKASLLPFSTLFSILPRMVREIAGRQGKQVDLEIFGEEIEADKRILENLKDPLIHLLRNAVDHGIEKPDDRRQNRKPEKGLVRISVSQPENNRVKLKISDDGKGIDIHSIAEQAVKQGLLLPEKAAALTDVDLMPLIFNSGISTSPILTEISGRGLGMAIVKDGIESLGGSIAIESRAGSGTTFTIQLPVTVATFRGILVSVAKHYFLVPDVHVAHLLRITKDEIKTVENRTMISINGQPISLVSLADALGIPGKATPPDPKRKAKNPSQPVVVLKSGDKQIAFIVDEIINEQEVLVKNLGRQLKRVPNISGATILGSGRVVPVINVNDLIRTSADRSLPAATPEASGMQPEKPKSILVIEDSLTARTLLKNILEASGYIVKTAVNGEDGYNRIKATPFDAVVSDVEMPRMNGFELTREIRKDQALSDTPVILVTNLDSAVDRERGIDAGADAYIVKSSFDRSNLLEVIQRLV